jgi:glutathione-regulated potassium-efflux system ancillary protein KefG
MSHPRRRLHRPPHSAEGAVLVLLAHPDLRRSRANRRLAQAIADLEGVTVHDLYEAWPDLHIDVPTEKGLLERHRALVWLHPFYWYSTPAILKQWQDLVLELGWAYGPGGTALRGKPFLQCITTGGGENAYQPDGMHAITLPELVTPANRMARLCGMVPLDPFVVHGTFRLDDAALDQAAQDFRARIIALRDSLPVATPG